MNNSEQHIDYDLLMRYLAGEASTQQIEEVEQWLQSSADNKRHLDELEKVWIETGKISPPPVAVDTDKAWNTVFAKIQPDSYSTIPLKTKVKAVNSVFKIYVRIAAVLLICFGIYGIIRTLNKDIEQITIASSEVVTEHKLPDDSKIDLNANSKISYPEKFDGKSREVSFEGEAYFEIAENKQQPFIIHTEVADITVLGTSFNVNAYPKSQRVEVIVDTGRVRLSSNSEISGDTTSIILKAGMTGVVDIKAGTLEKYTAVDENKLFWKTNRLVFHEFKLIDVFSILEEQFDVHLEMTNPKLEDCVLSATFENNEIEYILETIANSFELELKKENGAYIFEGYSCE